MKLKKSENKTPLSSNILRNLEKHLHKPSVIKKQKYSKLLQRIGTLLTKQNRITLYDHNLTYNQSYDRNISNNVKIALVTSITKSEFLYNKIRFLRLNALSSSLKDYIGVVNLPKSNREYNGNYKNITNIMFDRSLSNHKTLRVHKQIDTFSTYNFYSYILNNIGYILITRFRERRKMWLIRSLVRSYHARFGRISGYCLKIKGPLKASGRSKTTWIRGGNVSSTTFDANISYYSKHIHTPFGVFGIKYWLKTREGYIL